MQGTNNVSISRRISVKKIFTLIFSEIVRTIEFIKFLSLTFAKEQFQALKGSFIFKG